MTNWGLLRLTTQNFDYVLERIVPTIARNDTRFRKCVGAEERLAITLRFLAPSASYKLRAVIGYLLQQTLSSRAHYTTNVWPIQFCESARRLLSWSGQQHTNVLASLRPAYIRQLLGVSRQIIRLLGVSRLMYARHNPTLSHDKTQSPQTECKEPRRKPSFWEHP